MDRYVCSVWFQAHLPAFVGKFPSVCVSWGYDAPYGFGGM